jgi:hypothetical protein
LLPLFRKLLQHLLAPSAHGSRDNWVPVSRLWLLFGTLLQNFLSLRARPLKAAF